MGAPRSELHEVFNLADKAPVYDTARGLFADHREHKFVAVEARGGREVYIRRYAERSQPVFVCANSPEKPNHFELIRYGLEHFGATLRGPVSQMLTAYQSERIESMLEREFGRLISPLRMLYVTALLKHRVFRLRKILMESLTS